MRAIPLRKSLGKEEAGSLSGFVELAPRLRPSDWELAGRAVPAIVYYSRKSLPRNLREKATTRVTRPRLPAQPFEGPCPRGVQRILNAGADEQHHSIRT